MFTVEQIREDVAPFVGETGKCPDHPKVLEYINSARRLLWPRGDWRGTVETICIQSFCGYITLPYDYLRIKDAKTCGGFVNIDTEWYEVVDNQKFPSSCMGDLIDMGDKFATFKDYIVDGNPVNHRLAVMAEATGDAGKKVSFNAIGEHGDRLSLTSLLADDHVKVTVNDWIKNYRHATKDPTIGRVRVYIYDPNRGVMDCCAIYEPHDIAPQYRRYRIRVNAGKYFYARCKKRYRPLFLETDPVEFNTDALIQGMHALNARRNNESSAYQTAIQLAHDHLSQDSQDAKPDGQSRMKLSKARRVENLNQIHCPHRLD